jgi:quercetin dioxygenase-like cupin family protein
MSRERTPISYTALHDDDDVQPSPALRERVLASVDPARRLEGFVARTARLFDLSEERMREVLCAANSVSAPSWVAVGPTLRLFHFDGGPSRADADCGLVQVAAGASFPLHRHRGIEWNFVLSGAAEENSGELWLPGDLVLREPGTVHGYRVLPDEPVLFAVVLEDTIEVLGNGDAS